MSWFRRSRQSEASEPRDGDAGAEQAVASEAASQQDANEPETADEVREAAAEVSAQGADRDASGAPSSAPVRPDGPWDVADQPDLDGRIDLGALRLPAVDGMQLRMEVDRNTEEVTGAAVALHGTVVQLQAFAAPRVEQIWPEIREEIAASATHQGGTADEVEGPFGLELLARLPFKDEKGRSGHRPARFIGVDGPRWFVRAVISGRAAVDAEAAQEFEELIAQTVVVRGGDARPPRDVLALTLPNAGGAEKDDNEAPTPDDFNPLKRGPEITEIR